MLRLFEKKKRKIIPKRKKKQTKKTSETFEFAKLSLVIILENVGGTEKFIVSLRKMLDTGAGMIFKKKIFFSVASNDNDTLFYVEFTMEKSTNNHKKALLFREKSKAIIDYYYNLKTHPIVKVDNG